MGDLIGTTCLLSIVIMSSFLWISVILKCGSIIVIPRNVLQCSFEEDIVNNLQLTSKVAKVSISSNAMFVDPNHDVPLNAPLSL